MEYWIAFTLVVAIDPARTLVTIILALILPNRWWGILLAAVFSAVGIEMYISSTDPLRTFGDQLLPGLVAGLFWATLARRGGELFRRKPRPEQPANAEEKE